VPIVDHDEQMRLMSTPRARRVEVPRELAGEDAPSNTNYVSAFALTTANAQAATAEQWSRAVFEGAPAPLRWLMLTGWERVLGLRLGARHSAAHVLGWPISESAANSITLQSRSRLLAAENVLVVSETCVMWVTRVRFDRASGRPLWAMAKPIHHLLKRASVSFQGS
jgi:hypothetical protein